MSENNNESGTESPRALEYIRSSFQKINEELSSTLEVYGKNMSQIEKKKMLETLQRVAEERFSKLKESYSTMRRQRGELISIQDMDDIMPYVRLTALKELHQNLFDENYNRFDELRTKIEMLEDTVSQTTDALGTLRNTLPPTSPTLRDTYREKFISLGEQYQKDALTSLSQKKSIGRAEMALDESQKIRINASNLVVRSAPKKDASPVRDKETKNITLLQTGDEVKPVLDIGGNLIIEQDSQRNYVRIQLSDGSNGWVALSDTIGGKYQQEYADTVFGGGTLDTTKTFELNDDNVKLYTGFYTDADSIDTLTRDTIGSLQRIVYENEGDTRPESNGTSWAQVEVTYKNGEKKRGYIEERYLSEISKNTLAQ